jgi:hypothetical protein
MLLRKRKTYAKQLSRRPPFGPPAPSNLCRLLPSPLDGTEIVYYDQRSKQAKIKQDSQCKYNVPLVGVHATMVAVGNQ